MKTPFQKVGHCPIGLYIVRSDYGRHLCCRPLLLLSFSHFDQRFKRLQQNANSIKEKNSMHTYSPFMSANGSFALSLVSSPFLSKHTRCFPYFTTFWKSGICYQSMRLFGITLKLWKSSFHWCKNVNNARNSQSEKARQKTTTNRPM